MEAAGLAGRVTREVGLGAAADERFLATFFKATSKTSETARREKRARGPNGSPSGVPGRGETTTTPSERGDTPCRYYRTFGAHCAVLSTVPLSA